MSHFLHTACSSQQVLCVFCDDFPLPNFNKLSATITLQPVKHNSEILVDLEESLLLDDTASP